MNAALSTLMIIQNEEVIGVAYINIETSIISLIALEEIIKNCHHILNLKNG